MFEVSPEEVRGRVAAGAVLLDVRQPEEHEAVRIEGSLLIPLPELQQRFNELPKGREIIAYCHHGPRGRQAATLLRAMGFNVVNMAGGIDAYSTVDKSVPKYEKFWDGTRFQIQILHNPE